MPLEKIYDAELSLIEGFHVNVRPFELYVDRAVDLMLEFRDLKSKLGVGSADFHYLATASAEGCDLFVSTDEKHLLRRESRERFSKYIPIAHPPKHWGESRNLLVVYSRKDYSSTAPPRSRRCLRKV